MRKKKQRTVELCTPFEGKIDRVTPYIEYPRPQLKRESYISLNGTWKLSVMVGQMCEYTGDILVPFPPESRISGVGRITVAGQKLVYSRTFDLPEGFVCGRVILHFGAVDQYARVFINNCLVGESEGGYLPFSFDITEWLCDAENTITVEVDDPLDTELPYGKQREKRGGMWYTSVSGIWQSVWLESVPVQYIRSLRMDSGLEGVTIHVEGGAPEKELCVKTPAGERKYSFAGDTYFLKVEEPVHWSPDNPYLYYFTIKSGEDTVSSYFALRTVGVEQVGGRAQICLNGKPYFLHGLLDQGYYSDGIYLPGTPEGYLYDILSMKACGFNMLRKHIKIEPELFYYYCDKHGMIVLQDMVNSGRYNFIIDTALPNVFLRRGVTHSVSDRRREAFYRCADGMMDMLYNHPCVCAYTIFNEGWGQFSADENYKRFKERDPSRIYDTTSGWFKERLSDVDSEHVYFRPLRLRIRRERPMLLSEFGGYSCKVEGHSYNLDNNYGCRVFTEDRDEFERELCKLYEKEVLPAIRDGLGGAVLTQVSDVEDETNGLVTYDRQVLKVDPKRMSELAQKLFEAFDETNSAL